MKHSCKRQKQSFFFYQNGVRCEFILESLGLILNAVFSLKKKKKQYLSFESKTARYKRYLFNF